MKQFFRIIINVASASPGRLLLAGLLLLSYLTGWAMPLNPASALSASCADVEFIFARGSGEPLAGPSAQAWQDSIRAELATSHLRYNFYELGSQTIAGFRYPAVRVSNGLDGYGNLVGAYISGGAAFEFGASVRQGQAELEARVRQVSTSCPGTKFVLGGYSQGAMLITGILDRFNPDQIAYVATFGDPKLYLPEGKSYQTRTYRKIPDACLGKNLSDYREHVPDCYAYEGVLGSYRPYQPAGFRGKLGTWCNDNDIMCSSGYNIADHSAYVKNDLYKDAARVIVRQLASLFPAHVTITTTTDIATHDVAILIDSTGSMSSLISKYKAEAKSLAQRVLASGGRVALFEYRDLSDPFATRQHCDFSCTLEEFSQRIDEITVSGGGDTPESALSALLTTLNSLSWQSGATKSIVLLTDAGYHSPDLDGTTLQQVVLRSLEIDPVNVYLLAAPHLQTTYASLISQTNGRAFNANTEIGLSSKVILGRPVAKLSLSEYSGSVGQEFSFDAGRSYSPAGGELHFDWDLDGDGIFELVDAKSAVQKSYPQPFSGFIQVRVRSGELSSTMSAKVTVRSSDRLPLATISNLTATPVAAGSTKISFETSADRVLVALDDAVLGFLDKNQRQFILRDLTKSCQVTLIPYDANGRKGITESLTIDPNQSSAPRPSIIPSVPNTGIANLF